MSIHLCFTKGGDKMISAHFPNQITAAVTFPLFFFFFFPIKKMWGLGEAEFKHENHIDDGYESDCFLFDLKKLGHYSHNAFWLP